MVLAMEKRIEDYRIIGKRIPRKDAIPKVTGQAKYVGDISLPGMLYGVIVRSKYPHAIVKEIDVNKAIQLPGVKTILTHEDVPRIPCATKRHVHEIRDK